MEKNFEKIKNNLLEDYKNQLEKLKELKNQLEEAKKNSDERKIIFYSKRIKSVLQIINNTKTKLSCMRLNDEKDIEERRRILNNYKNIIDETIPDDIPIVFHGNNNIELVKQIIGSGGLFTPEERDVDFKSFATQIDVTAKTNIRVSLEFADSGVNSFMPYGAIFAFYPKEHEYENVLKTKDNSEVFGGVESVKFDEDRFVGIITTKENIESLKKCMIEHNLDPNKIFTHEEFIEYCNKKFLNSAKTK